MTLSATSISGKSGAERAGRSDAAAARFPQSARPGACRAAAGPRSSIPTTRRSGSRRRSTVSRSRRNCSTRRPTSISASKQAKTSLARARSDADLLDVAGLLWAMALQIENGDGSQAERDLRAAEQALREALKRGASDEEIKKLMEHSARGGEALHERDGAQRRARTANADDQNAQSQDLDKMLDQMEDTARNGSREDAEAMLDQMQEMFENMRSAREAQESPAEREMQQADQRAREAAARPAGVARRHLPQRSARPRAQAARVIERPRQGDDGHSRSRTRTVEAPDEGDNDPTRRRQRRPGSGGPGASARRAPARAARPPRPNCSAGSRASA